MDEHDPLMVGMFWGGLIMALAPVSLGVGVGIYVLKRYLEGKRVSRED
jgi:hypothetical protein